MSATKRIKAKLSQEYEAFMADVRTMSKDDMISRIDVIADTTAIYHYLTGVDMDFDDRDAQGLLLCDRPLEEIVGYWQYNYKDSSEGMDESITEVSENALSNAVAHEDELAW